MTSTQDVLDVRHLELDQRLADVLAIGSQLTYGRVGLNATLPVFDEHGLRYASVPTTILSVLPHYSSVHRTDLSAAWLADTLLDLHASGALDQLRAISIGYLATVDQAHALEHWRRTGPEALAGVPLILDPTLGDVGLGFYNDPRLVEPLRGLLVPQAWALTPNLFELAQLTGTTPEALLQLETITEAARTLLSDRTQWIVVTGLRGEALGDSTGSQLIGELVLSHDSADLLTHPLLPGGPAGVGDTFAAALIVALLDGASVTDAARRAAVATAAHIRQEPRS